MYNGGQLSQKNQMGRNIKPRSFLRRSTNMGTCHQPISVPMTRLTHGAQILFILHMVPGDKDRDPTVNSNSKMDLSCKAHLDSGTAW